MKKFRVTLNHNCYQVVIIKAKSKPEAMKIAEETQEGDVVSERWVKKALHAEESA